MADMFKTNPDSPQKQTINLRHWLLMGLGAIVGGWLGAKTGLAWEKYKYGQVLVDDLVGSMGLYLGGLAGTFIGGATTLVTSIACDKRYIANKQPLVGEKSIVAISTSEPARSPQPEMVAESGKYTRQLDQERAHFSSERGI